MAMVAGGGEKDVHYLCCVHVQTWDFCYLNFIKMIQNLGNVFILFFLFSHFCIFLMTVEHFFNLVTLNKPPIFT